MGEDVPEERIVELFQIADKATTVYWEMMFVHFVLGFLRSYLWLALHDASKEGGAENT